ncbi:MAG: MFS transporter [Candidatus Aminicenantes bacterium]|nr:MFS transporter [Candidatus Aminicenantes bacterium]
MKPNFAARLNGRFSWSRTFTALRYPNYRLWFWGQMTSLFGSWMQITAQGYLMYQLTRSPAHLGYVGFAAGLPTWLFMLYAGVVADRVPRRRLLIVTQTAMMVLAFLTAALTFADLIRPWHLIALAFGFGTANAFDAPARHAIVNELVPTEDMTNAIALNSAMFNAATAVGPAVGGVTYALLGPGWCFVVNGLSFIAVIAALAAMKLAPFIRRPGRNSVLGDLKEGVGYVAGHGLIRTIIGLVAVISLFGFAFATLVPAWAVKVLGGDAMTNGLLHGTRGLGALAAALAIASLGRFQFRGALITLGSIAFPLLLILFAFVRSPGPAYLVLFGVGFALILVFNLANATVQTLTPIELRGRVMSIYSLTFFGLMPIGALLIGWSASRAGEPAAVIINAALTLVYALVVLVFFPRLRRLK